MTMSYIDHPGSSQPGSGPRKYYGNVAAGYDAKREDSPKWKEEQRIIEEMMGTLKTGSSVIDVPVGSGRFIPYAELRKFKYLGVDISKDMLAQAAGKILNPASTLVELANGNVLEEPKPNFHDQFDCALMIRLTRWLEPEECMTAMHNLMEVTKDTGRIIFTYREDGKVPRPKAMWDEILDGTGWSWYKNEAASEEGYRVAQLRKT